MINVHQTKVNILTNILKTFQSHDSDAEHIQVTLHRKKGIPRLSELGMGRTVRCACIDRHTAQGNWQAFLPAEMSKRNFHINVAGGVRPALS